MRYLFLIVSMIFVFGAKADPLVYSIGKTYCHLTHPVESIAPIRRSACEEQHVIQQQDGGGDYQNVVWWSGSAHTRTDVWNDKPWQESRPIFVFGFTDDNNTNLEKAYMMGTYGLTWSLYQHSYHGDGDSSLIITEFDGVSNALYFVSWLINLPQKYINQVAYIADRGHFRLALDLIPLVFVVLFEIVMGFVTSAVGVVLGTVFNPIDTLLAIPSGVALLIESAFSAIAELVAGLWRILSAGIFGWIMLPVSILILALPKRLIDRFQSI